ncbi:hypothetical protein OBBRIDRAFT_138667 [Obba rivulosa]|uniref:Uncharacterized protein n=1 Tax=Obba rivulosa TaxID=1052685 RepID=A0A8E2DI41_9APHY|nr:hypothetical protein OBBRIDRAFT_138667 [Obba rivulosa]
MPAERPDCGEKHQFKRITTRQRHLNAVQHYLNGVLSELETAHNVHENARESNSVASSAPLPDTDSSQGDSRSGGISAASISDSTAGEIMSHSSAADSWAFPDASYPRCTCFNPASSSLRRAMGDPPDPPPGFSYHTCTKQGKFLMHPTQRMWRTQPSSYEVSQNSSMFCSSVADCLPSNPPRTTAAKY